MTATRLLVGTLCGKTLHVILPIETTGAYGFDGERREGRCEPRSHQLVKRWKHNKCQQQLRLRSLSIRRPSDPDLA